ncbi:MAG: WD40 repeat domain-containing protein [Planctomycetota bacterium]|nr:WD40 repeat domain-containing protein [Planctomycetota bacterium]
MLRFTSVLTLLLLTFFAVTVTAEDEPAFDTDIEEICEISENTRLYFSSNMSGVALVNKTQEGEVFVFDGKESDPFDEILTVAVSPDGKKAACVGIRNYLFHVHYRGKDSRQYELVCPDSLLFTGDSRTLLYVVKDEEEMFVVENNRKEQEHYDLVRSLVLSQEGKTYAYVGGMNVGGMGEKEYRTWPVINGKEYKNFLYPSNISVSPDGRHFAFIADRGDENMLFVDGKDQGEVGGGIMNSVFFSENGRNWIVALPMKSEHDKVQEENGWEFVESKMFVLYNGKSFGPYERVSSVRLSPDGRHYAYLAETETEKQLIRDGDIVEKFDLESYPSLDLSQDGKSVLFEKDGKLYLNDKVIGEASFISTHGFTPDGNVYYTKESEEGSILCFGDEEKCELESHTINCMTFSDRGKSFIFRCGVVGGIAAVMNGERVGVYKQILRAPTPRSSASCLDLEEWRRWGDFRNKVRDLMDDIGGAGPPDEGDEGEEDEGEDDEWVDPDWDEEKDGPQDPEDRPVTDTHVSHWVNGRLVQPKSFFFESEDKVFFFIKKDGKLCKVMAETK